MKAKFIKKGKEIFFQDKNGANWDENCIAELFEMVHAFNNFLKKVQYFNSERVDGKDLYEE